jgi:hypothetical protein
MSQFGLRDSRIAGLAGLIAGDNIRGHGVNSRSVPSAGKRISRLLIGESGAQ